MRIDVKKVLFYGSHLALTPFFERAQEAGLIHFIEKAPLPKEVPQKIQDALQAIKVIRGFPVLKQESLDFSEAEWLISSILEMRHAIESKQEKLRIDHLEAERIRPFGQFSLKDLSWIETHGKRVIQFFFSKKGILTELPKELIFVTSDHGLDYFISINEQNKQYDKLIEMKFDLSLSDLERQQLELKQEIQLLEAELKLKQKYHSFIYQVLGLWWNVFSLESAKVHAESLMHGKLFAVAGWVPKNKIFELHKILPEEVQMEEIAVEDKDQIPTYLENEGIPRLGQDVIQIYDTPSNTDKDPSLWVLLSFAFFFAMIIGDGGYGLVFLAIALYMRYKTGALEGMKSRLMQLFFLLSLACIGWGVLTNSFFGIEFAPDSIMRKFSVVQWLAEKKAAYHIALKDETWKSWVEKIPDLKQISNPQKFLQGGDNILTTFTSNIMMELALLIGSVHIICSLLRYVRSNWAAFGWVLFIIGAYFYLPFYLKATSILHFITPVSTEEFLFDGQVLMVVGLGFALIASLIQNKIYGLLEITNIIQIFSDILSYLRLYALALAGSIISVIVNDVAGKIFFSGGFILLLVGHGFNMVLSVIGGVIHGLRLNFIEWYHYSFEGGGKLFKPLSKTKVTGG